MYCTKAISRGAGGCFVVNWRNENDRPAGRPNAGTVAMNISPEGFTRFYAFGSNGILTPSVRLDSEDPKFVPKVCVVCHAGATPVPATGDLGSVFREFETSLLKAPTGVSAGQMEASWLGLNDAVRAANQSVRSEAEGAAEGTDFAKARTVGHITGELYGGPSATTSVPLGSQGAPASWDQAGDPLPLRTAKLALWRSVVAPSCMPCHRAIQDFDWADYL